MNGTTIITLSKRTIIFNQDPNVETITCRFTKRMLTDVLRLLARSHDDLTGADLAYEELRDAYRELTDKEWTGS